MFLLLCLVLEVWTGDLTSMPSDQLRVVAAFESLKFIKEQSNVSPHSLEPLEPIAEFFAR